MNITLIGYRATGKTTLARLLAERLRWAWIDADVEIERRAGKAIARIFAEDGEPAAGGGAPLRPDNRQAIRAAGKVVWLTARPETIHARMSGDATTASRRPSLTDRDALAEIVHLLARREPIYREAADLVVDTEGKTPEQVAAEILEKLHLTCAPGGTA